MQFFKELKIKWKILTIVLPLSIIPIILVSLIIGYIATSKAYKSITRVSEQDLNHIAEFTRDLLNSHYNQFHVYREEKITYLKKDLSSIAKLSYNVIESYYKQYKENKLSIESARSEAKRALKNISIGEGGYIYVIDSKGFLISHVAKEGENIINERDDKGRYFIREIISRARSSKFKEIQYIVYPWKNEKLGEKEARNKLVAFIYFKEWDWIIGVGSYLEDKISYEFEKKAFDDLKRIIKSKKVGDTGYIYIIDLQGNLVVHPAREGENIYDSQDIEGKYFIQEMIEKKNGWIRYPWKNPEETEARYKIVRYLHFEPYNWIVAAGSYENEFYSEANRIKQYVLTNMILILLVFLILGFALSVYVSDRLTQPISRIIDAVRDVKKGNLENKVYIDSGDELAELADNINRMMDILAKQKELEKTLNEQTKLASLGVLASSVAHEINNPLGVILGYLSFMEGKLTPDDKLYNYLKEMKGECQRCKKIVENFLNFARIPKPDVKLVSINELLTEIISFVSNHPELKNIEIKKELADNLPQIFVDPDQIRQVALNMILNSAEAIGGEGIIRVKTEKVTEGFVNIIFEDNGQGIPEENIKKIFEPFFSTKVKGTGLGLAIVRQIVKQHLGNISVESKPNVGTRFVITLPVSIT